MGDLYQHLSSTLLHNIKIIYIVICDQRNLTTEYCQFTDQLQQAPLHSVNKQSCYQIMLRYYLPNVRNFLELVQIYPTCLKRNSTLIPVFIQ